jgi:hypothetical protein
MEFKINKEKDIYKALKEGYLRDARNRNNYPIVSFNTNISFSEELNKNQQKIFNDEYILFNKWKNKIKNLIPKLRKRKKIKEKEIYEKKQLEVLAEKYGYSLNKTKEKN